MMGVSWKDFTNLAGELYGLISNVKTLQKQLDKAVDQINENREELQNLKADLRVARAELESVAVNKAANTVIQAHEQIIGRLHQVEEGIRKIENDGDKLTITDVSDAKQQDS